MGDKEGRKRSRKKEWKRRRMVKDGRGGRGREERRE